MQAAFYEELTKEGLGMRRRQRSSFLLEGPEQDNIPIHEVLMMIMMIIGGNEDLN